MKGFEGRECALEMLILDGHQLYICYGTDKLLYWRQPKKHQAT
jgi:hypothetical protein